MQTMNEHDVEVSTMGLMGCRERTPLFAFANSHFNGFNIELSRACHFWHLFEMFMFHQRPRSWENENKQTNELKSNNRALS